jgi:hypothetical protein
VSDELKQALTANRLSDGEVVFGGEGSWVEKFSQAKLYADKAEAEAALEAAKGQVTTIIDPYLIDISLENGQPVPIALRERVRALGPTIHPDMGKQTEGGPVIEAIVAAHGAARSAGRYSLIKRK